MRLSSNPGFTVDIEDVWSDSAATMALVDGEAEPEQFVVSQRALYMVRKIIQPLADANSAYFEFSKTGGCNMRLRGTAPAKVFLQRYPDAMRGADGTLVQWFEPGKTYDFKGFVRGESVNGNNIWFVGKYTGHYVWSGGFTSQSTAGLPDLSPDPKPVVLQTPYERTVGSVAVNLRKGAGPNFGLLKLGAGSTVEDGMLDPGKEYVFQGYVRGQKVGTSDIWLLSKSGGYAHIDGFLTKALTGLPDLTPKVTVPVVTPPKAPVTAPAASYSFNKAVSCVTEVRPARVGHFQAEGLPKRR